MSHWPFIIAAYAASFLGTGGLAVWSYAAMRGAEAQADALRAER